MEVCVTSMGVVVGWVHSSREIEPSNGKVVVLYSSVETAGMVICVVITCEVVEGGAGVRTSCLPFGE